MYNLPLFFCLKWLFNRIRMSSALWETVPLTRLSVLCVYTALEKMKKPLHFLL